MSIEIIGQFIPINNKTFPVTNVVYIKGGNRVVADTTARDNIPQELISENSLVYVTGTSTFYYLDNGIWTDIDFLTNNNFNYTQSSLSNQWTINHNLGFYPQISTFDENGEEILGQITHNGNNQVVIDFNQNFRGSGFLS